MAEKKAQKKPKARVAPDRVELMKRSNIRAGKGKGDLETRKKQNIGVRGGTIRIGKGGRSYNVYDSKTGTWLKGVVKAKPKKVTKPKSLSDMSKPNKYSFGGLGAGGSTGGSAKEYLNYKGRYVPYPRYGKKK